MDLKRKKFIAQQTDITEENAEREFGSSGVYYRLSPEYTIKIESPTTPDNIFGFISSYTRAYLERVTVTRLIEGFLRASARTGDVDLTLQSKARASASITSHIQSPTDVRLSREEKGVLSELRIKGIKCGSPVQGCMPGTRKAILDQIQDWAVDLNAPNILWLKGHPGVGKSAIATEVVDQLVALGRLGSSFFFQRQKAAELTPHALWRSVSYDLARRHSSVRKTVILKLEEDAISLETPNLDSLFHHFIHEPLMGATDIPNARLPVVVIDALEECGGLEGQHSPHRKALINTLHHWSQLPAKFKLIVTSRGENDIERLFSATKHHLIEMLAGDMVDAQSSEDIRVFLIEELRKIATQYVLSLPQTNWPDTQTIDVLVYMAAGLFIWAQTVVNFISRGEPEWRLNQVLEGRAKGNIDALYNQILNIYFSNENMEDFRTVVGAIILAKAPLSFTSLVHLLSMSRSTVEHICIGLQSVLEYHDNLRFHHQSFVDFLLKCDKSTLGFSIERGRENRKLALACFRVLNEELKFNICSVESSYLRNADIIDLASRAEASITPHLLYSSLWWGSHLVETRFDLEVFGRVQYFMGKQFLSWLEVLSVFQRVNMGSETLLSLVEWIPPNDHPEAVKFAKDMQNFVNTFAAVISQSVTHIYVSALPFSPPVSVVWKHYIPEYGRTLTVRNGGLSNWPAFQRVLAEHTSVVASVGFSPDGKRIVSGSWDKTIRVWDTKTGTVIAGPFEGHNSPVSSVGFSRSGERIVSGSWDKSIRVWNAETGALVSGPFRGHSDKVTSVGFSPDEKHIVSGSDDKTIRVWDTEMGTIISGPFEGHNGVITSVGLSPDGKRVVSGSGDKTIRIWDAETGKSVNGPLEGHNDLVSSVEFSPDGKRIVSCSDDKTIRIWDSRTGALVSDPFRGHSNKVTSVGFSPDGRRIISGSRDATIRVWDAETGAVVAGPFEGHSTCVSSVGFSPDGKRIASGSWDATIRLWSVETGAVVAIPVEGHSDLVRSVGFSPDGKRIVSGSVDKTIRIWDAETGTVVTGPLEGHNDGVNSVGFSPDGKHIISGSSDKTIRVWDAQTGEIVAGPLEGHTDSITSVAFSPDGKYIVSGSDDKTIRVWDPKTGAAITSLLKIHSDVVTSVAFSPNGKRIIAGSSDKTIRIWKVETGVAIDPLEGHSHSISSVGFSPDGKCIVSSSWDKTIRIWDAITGEVVTGPIEGHSYPVSSVGFNPNGKRIVSGSWDNTIRIWNAETGAVMIGPLEGHTHPVNSVGFSPDGKRVVSCSDDKTIRVWNAEKVVVFAGAFEGHNYWINSVEFSPDGTRIVSCSDDKTVRVWNIETGKLVANPLKEHSDAVVSVAFSPDGRRIASGSWDKTIRIWDVERGVSVAGPFRGHSNRISTIGFSPDGKHIVSGSWDNTIRVWNIDTGTVSGSFEGHRGCVTSVKFSPNGRRIVSGSTDKTILVWNAQTGAVVAGPLKGHTKGVTSIGISPDGKQIVSGSWDKTIRIWSIGSGAVAVDAFEGHADEILSVVFVPDGKHIVSGSMDKTILVWNAETGAIVAGPLKGHTSAVTSVGISPDGRHIVSSSRDKTIRIWRDLCHGIQRSSSTSSIFTDSSKMQNGWVLGPHSELLFWVPSTLRPGLCWPRNINVLGDNTSTKLDLSHFVHGNMWALCKLPKDPANCESASEGPLCVHTS
ncbi:hypothetical protein M408DRAFT_333140 [Serendipita vermifera MAFF 305830]|uniref:Nephrocystin 3-like N-terminal domain-containing protein n=1 Tax=Serendipita vermifera MAFF 305830 TaxID=933852 RepID=A0A0C3ABJ9_SERVB|nr:hypothetical protein M408DRAFT_333140 [Serendipita vermifera MAFF 305830]